MVQGRWGHKAVYVPTTNMVYVVGGEISDRNGGPLKITNEVLQLNLSQSNPSPETLVTSSLLPTAFHSLAYAPLTNQLVSFGGMTSSCRTDSILHSLDLDNTTGNLTWTSETSSGLLRRRGAGMVHLEATVGEAEGKLMVFGGAVDQYVCSSTSSYYSAFDVIPYPLSDAAVHNSDKMAASSSSPIGVSDFAMTALANDTVLFVGGTDVNGDMVKMDKLTAWSDEQDWYSLKLMGEIPEARVGASMVAHPTLKDLVILHGGAIQDGASTSATASISLLNLTTLTWSSPYNVQPARQDARAWHSDIITSSGVLVSAFGIGAGNNPHSEVNFLDMRDSNVANWGWKRTWTTNMLNSNPASGPATGPTSGTTSPGSGSAANVKVPATSSNVADAEENGDDGSLKKILPPTLIIGLVLLGLLVWLARRQVNIVRRRRLARHFEIDNTHDEEGNRRASLFEPVTQFMAKRGWNRSSPFAGLPRPFGGVRIPDGDETETAGWQSSLAGVVGRLTGKNQTQATSSGEMRQVDGRNVSRTRWEEIDFGLGRVDEQRRSSVGPTRPGTPGRPSEDTSRQIPAREFNKNRSRVSFPPDNEPVDPAYLPALVVVPPSNPSTPNSEPRAGDPFADYPVLMPSPRIHETISEKPEVDPKTRAEWDELEREVETAQPFRRSGTVSSTHSVGSTGSKEIEPLPRLSFEQKTSSEFSHSLSSYGIGLGKPITRRASGNDSVGIAIAGRSVSSPSSHSPPRDYNSAATVGYSPSYVRDLITGPAQSPARIPRSGELSRSSTMSDRPHSSVNLFNKYQSNDGDSSLSLADYRMDGAPVRVQRLSNPPRFPPPTSPLPQAPSTGVSRRVSTSDALERSSDNVGTLARPTGEVRQLRVVNATPRPDEVDEFGSKA